ITPGLPARSRIIVRRRGVRGRKQPSKSSARSTDPMIAAIGTSRRPTGSRVSRRSRRWTSSNARRSWQSRPRNVRFATTSDSRPLRRPGAPAPIQQQAGCRQDDADDDDRQDDEEERIARAEVETDQRRADQQPDGDGRRIEHLEPEPDDLDHEDPEADQQHTREPERRVVVGPVRKEELRRRIRDQEQQQARWDQVSREVVQAQVRPVHRTPYRVTPSDGAGARSSSGRSSVDPIVAGIGRARRSGSRPSPTAIAAVTNPSNSGCGRSGRLLNSGWNWLATNHGWSFSSTISTSRPSGLWPLRISPAASSVWRY